ncbi:MAG: copper amine oxidase N-terminal domain-containing protein [Acidimicrobiia bacterium]|nr:copper amine oxidase N-terminal domain-containing protein [Acidimicrobiia bacterium]
MTALTASLASVLVAASQPASLRVDGEKIASDVPPVTSIKGDAYLPLRAVADAVGADTNYDPKTGVVELIRGQDTLRLRAGVATATLNGKKISLRHAPFAVRGRTMVGLYTVARAFGSHVSYDHKAAKIEVQTSPGMVEAGAQVDEF